MNNQTLQNLLQTGLDTYLKSGKIEEIIQKNIEKMFTDVIASCFHRYNDGLGSSVEKAVKNALPSNIESIIITRL